MPGFEPGSADSKSTVLTDYTTRPKLLRPGIEPGSLAWKASILPLYQRSVSATGLEPVTWGTTVPRSTNWAMPRLIQDGIRTREAYLHQNLSLTPLTTREPVQI